MLLDATFFIEHFVSNKLKQTFKMVLEDSTKIDSIDVVTIDAFEFILSKLQVKLVRQEWHNFGCNTLIILKLSKCLR